MQAGGGLSITLDADPLYVFCNAQADFFLGWMPFFYSIEASFDFGVSFRLHVVFCTIHISVDISADPARTVLSVVTTMLASTVTLNGAEVASGSPIALHARPVDNSPDISPTLLVTIAAASGDANDLIPWTPTAVVAQVASAVWGTTSSGELIPANPEKIAAVHGPALQVAAPPDLRRSPTMTTPTPICRKCSPGSAI